MTTFPTAVGLPLAVLPYVLPGLTLSRYEEWTRTDSRDNAVLTSDDVGACAWVREHTPPSAVFATKYDDDGSLIAAVAHRAVQMCSIIAPALSKGRITPVATEHDTTGNGEGRRQRVALAVVTPEIRYLGQDLDQRT